MRNRLAMTALVLGLATASFLAAETRDPGSGRPGDVCQGAQTECDAEYNDGVWIPPGSDIWHEGAALRFRVPVGFVVWKRDEGGGYVKDFEADITCDCKEGDCSPYISGGIGICLAGPGCKSCCTRTTSSLLAVAVARDVHEVELTTPEKGARLPVFNVKLLEIPAIREAVDRFLARVYRGKPDPTIKVLPNGFGAPRDFRWVPVNIFGYYGEALVPKKIAKTSDFCIELLSKGLAKEDEDCGVAASCKCNSGSSGCTPNNSPDGKIMGCEAGACTSCTLKN